MYDSTGWLKVHNICGKWTNLHSPACNEPGASDESDLRERSSAVELTPIAEGWL